MSCLTRAELARLATTGESSEHLASCIDCRRAVERQRELHSVLARLPAPVATSEQRRAIKAETMAAVALEPLARRAPPYRAIAVAAGSLLAAAAVSITVFAASPVGVASPLIAAGSRELPSPIVRITDRESAPLRRAAPAITARPGALFTQTPGIDRDVIVLQDGALDVDARGARDVDVHVGPTTVEIADATVRVQARQYAITSVEVVVGAAHVIGPSQQVTLERGTVWTQQAVVAPNGLSSFRDAWIALRAGDNRAAVSLFDRATAPAVAEEASYWAAVAAKRSGDTADARRRFTEFVARFPTSPYVDQARRALSARD